jgi:hypothetical protein
VVVRRRERHMAMDLLQSGQRGRNRHRVVLTGWRRRPRCQTLASRLLPLTAPGNLCSVSEGGLRWWRRRGREV